MVELTGIRPCRRTRSRALMNANVLTPVAGSASELRRADAVLMRGGAIASVGSEHEVRERAPAGTEFVDLRGRTVVPGFVDAHIHPIFYGLSLEGVPCLPPDVTSIADLRRGIEERALGGETDDWIWGQGYDDTRLVEGRHPTRDDLDAPAAGRPVVLTRVCGHMCVANSRALELAGIDATTPDPPGGRIERDAAGEPTGLLLETAESLVLRHVSSEREHVLRALRRVSEDLLRHGITACCDAWLGYSEGAAEPEIWTEALASGAFRPGISFLVHHDLWRQRPDLPDTSLNVIGVKVVADGSVSGGSAGLAEPFLDDEDHRLFVFDPGGAERALRRHQLARPGGRDPRHGRPGHLDGARRRGAGERVARSRRTRPGPAAGSSTARCRARPTSSAWLGSA